MTTRTRPLAAAALSLLLAAALAVIAGWQPAPRLTPAKADANPGSHDVIVHLFQWPWNSVASECTNVLGPKGFGAVQVSPPQEHVVLSGSGYPWWQDYQPVSYQLISRRGDRAAFANMVSTCHAAGVKIYVDAVINHMAGGASTGTGSAGSTYSHYNYPNLYSSADFHHCGRNGSDDIVNWGDRWEVFNCELVDLSDLATETSYVRGKLTAYLNDLISVGVDGFRVDAAKHIPVADLQAIYGGLTGNPYIYQEVIEDTAFPPTEYAGLGDVTEFRYGDVVGNAFRDANLSNLNNLASQMALGSGDAVNFVDNHDTQRNGRARLTYKDGQTHALAAAFSLAYPYGTPALMSSFTFSNNEAGPPSTNGTTNQVVCGSGWECEHRKTTVANLVGFHNAVTGTAVTNWTSPAANRIAFGRGATGFAAFNRDSATWSTTFSTGLPAGTYCNIAVANFSGGTCSGATVTVSSSGQATVSVAGNTALAIHTGAMVTGSPSPTTSAGPSPTSTACSSVAVTFESNTTTTTGQNVYVAGSIAALGSWNTASAVAMSSASYPVWRATVNLPAGTSFEYKYIKKDGSGNVTWESIGNRSHTVPTGVCAVTYSETWNTVGGTSPSPSASPTGSTCSAVTGAFAVNATTVWGQNVYVVGSIAALGSWSTGSAVALSSASYPVWTGSVSLPAGTSFTYKYIKKDGSGNVTWESDPNRSATTPTTAPCTVSLSDTWR
ncbi:alpha-amylase [Catellatospora sp. TT07R-123]|uniref:carbohydrate-binding module family 20 domain-containing protein n=1 Tax=Catellatospora sp. TT07R-123 TaxID=2733863 RepID=UPI001B212B9B|nr:carbohydrate-binding module family 20 domain-containing protein [Catellatospora sp. TT07R-123]GHJ45163.1 alpha-amylase [Catellatospora sp. TT07R-123]